MVARAKAIGWSQNRLARRLRKNVGHFSRVVRGERPSLSLLVKAEREVAKAEAKLRAAAW